MTNLQKINKCFAKYGYGWNPRLMWRNGAFSVTPWTNEDYIPVLAGKIASQESAVKKVEGASAKYKKALAAALLADPKAQALNADFDPSREETHPDQFWAYFNSLK